MFTSRLTRRCTCVAVVAAAFFAGAASALAQSNPSAGAAAVDAYVETVPSGSSVGQYVEAVPTARGPASPSAAKDHGMTSTPSTPKPAIDRALKTVAESSQYGAPASTPTRIDNADGGVPDARLTIGLSDSFRSALGALGTSSDARLIGLLAVIFATTVGAIIVSTRRGPR
jgi:hypothetical protein